MLVLKEFLYLTKLIEKTSSNFAFIAAYAAVVLVGLLIIIMLVVEHNQAKSLVQDNQVLMRDIVVKTLQSNISNLVADYPLDEATIDQNWLSLDANFEVYIDGDAIYPYRFKGVLNAEPSQLWQHYRDAIAGGKQNHLSEQSRARVKALIAIKEALVSSEPELLRLSIDAYFTQVQNYQLSVLEELVSGLSFLQLDKNSRWNDTLIEQMLTQQSLQQTPLLDYVFRQNAQLNSADLTKALQDIKQILGPTAIDQTWFTKNEKVLWQTKRLSQVDELEAYTIIDNLSLVLKPSVNFTLLLPFDTQSELLYIQQQLIKQGVLDNNDKINLSDKMISPSRTHISELAFDIQRNKWLEQIQHQQLYFVAKLIATILLVLSLLVLSRWIAHRQQKKLEYIQLRENFVNLVSHELKTPLASIRIMVETLQKRNERALSLKDYPEKIIAEVDQLWMMVDNLLSLNHIKSKELTLNMERCNLREIAERVGLKFEDTESDGVTIRNEIPSEVYLTLDALLFELVLLNLISNAVKYCDKDACVIQFEYDQQKHCLFLSDNACGISPENWLRVFDDFFREDNQLSRQGTGIGLSLCHQILQLHNVDISIKSSTKQGTLWCLDFSKLERNSESDA